MTDKENKGRPFVSFVLLDKADFSMGQLVSNLQADWGMGVSTADISAEQDAIVFTFDGMIAAVSLMPAPIPNNEAIKNAKTNLRWPEAAAVAQAHQAHLLMAVLPRDTSLADAGILMVKLCVSALKQPHATAVNTVGSVLAPDFYIDCALQRLRENSFPIMNLVFFGLYSRDGGKTVSGHTYGMSYFRKTELEVLDSTHNADEVFILLTDIAAYIIEHDVTLQDGETIGFTAEQKLTITESSAYMSGGVSLKIGF